jgi:hypothetical protein
MTIQATKKTLNASHNAQQALANLNSAQVLYAA